MGALILVKAGWEIALSESKESNLIMVEVEVLINGKKLNLLKIPKKSPSKVQIMKILLSKYWKMEH